jgi:hypothetical protein
MPTMFTVFAWRTRITVGALPPASTLAAVGRRVVAPRVTVSCLASCTVRRLRQKDVRGPGCAISAFCAIGPRTIEVRHENLPRRNLFRINYALMC